MKTKRITQLLTLAFCTIAFAFVTSCEGPEGPAGLAGIDGVDGTDGTNGVDGNVTCLECHSGATMQSVNEQFYQSVHSSSSEYGDGSERPRYNRDRRQRRGSGFPEQAGGNADRACQQSPRTAVVRHGCNGLAGAELGYRLSDPR